MSFSARLCIRIYRRLARAFPHEFQMVYAADVVRLGEDVVQDIAKTYGVFGLLRLVADLAWRVPAEYLSEMRQDLIYAWRNLLKSPGLAFAAVLSLGLGIGVPTAGFSEINVLLLRDFPGAKDASRLLTTQGSSSYVHYERFRDHHDLFSGVTAYLPAIPFNVSVGKEKPERAFGNLVSPEYFDVIGVGALRGRFDNEDGVVISERFWRTRLDADPDAVGRALRINGHQATVVGIGPKDFLGAVPVLPADIFVPLKMAKDFAPELGDDWRTHSDRKLFSVLMRVQPGVKQKSADAAADAIARQLDGESLDENRNAKGKRVRLLPGGGEIPRPPELIAVVVGFLGTLMALILGISCTNLANMLLARAAGRRKEIAIRLAVGASRWRLIRQLLTESLLLSLCGGIAGFAFAYWLTSAASRLYTKFPTPMPINLDIRPDWHVLLFTFALALIAGVGFGLAPALAATKTDFGPALKEGASTELHGFRRFGLRNLLMVYQVAGSMALLIITGFIVLGFSTRTKAEATFDASNLYLMTIDPVRDGYSPNQVAALFEKLRERMRNTPAIESAAFSDAPPGNIFPGGTTTLTVPAQHGETAKVVRSVAKEIIGSNYFATLHVKMAAGREFLPRDEQDASGAAHPAVISEVAAEQMFGTEDPIGRSIAFGKESFEVVGVAPDLRGRTLGVPPPPTVWIPLTRRAYERPPQGGVALIVRSAPRGNDAVNEVRHEIAAIDPNLTIFNLRTMRDYLDQSNELIQQTGYVYGGFGIFGLILASVGLASVTAYSVAQRRREIGIRMALGAQRSQVLRLVMKEGIALVIVGSALGFLGALAIGRILSAILPEIADALRTNQTALLIGAPLLLASLAMLACYFPARKSTKIDPLAALRQE